MIKGEIIWRRFNFITEEQCRKQGLGTYRVKDGDECRESVKYAIEQGYRSIDTAMIYGNEETVGQGIKEGLESTGLSREDLFITSKLWLTDFGRQNVEDAYRQSVAKLDWIIQIYI